MRRQTLLACLALLSAFGARAGTEVDGGMIGEESRTDGWFSYGRTYSEQHYSPLAQVNVATAARLGLAWHLDLPAAKSLVATPLMVDGALYFSSNDSIVYAVDARSGKLLWRHDPEVWKHAGKRYRQIFNVNRGVAYWKGRVYVGAFDGRLIALDAKTGHEDWSVQTLDVSETGYITGAPRAFHDMVLIGNGGTEAGRSRGFVTAYDAATGERRWRFFTVPGNPADGFENAAMEMAAKTWHGEWWKHGGGATVWHAMTYDPDFDRVYLGTGNGAPWNWKIRSPGGGDNLFVSSIVALDAKTGAYAWHYQTNPGENWDYSSAMDIVLADLAIAGKPRKVILHAPKNGFFYVIDRASGRVISAEKLGGVNWAERIDLLSGRPVENPAARFPTGEGALLPSGAGKHNWQAMSFNPRTGLVYLPTTEMTAYFTSKTIDYAHWIARPFFVGTGYDAVPTPPADFNPPPPSASLLAWNPVTQKKAWEVPLQGLWNGGTLTTAGNLVFQGNAAGAFVAYDARDGRTLWQADAGLGVVGAPITYALDGKQYVAVLAGWGGALPSAFGLGVAQHGWQYGQQVRRVLVYALDGRDRLPPTHRSPPPMLLDKPALAIDPVLATAGARLFNAGCQNCHGFAVVAGGGAPDLRASPVALELESLGALLASGREERGMPRYDDLSEAEVRALYHYIRQQARAGLTGSASRSAPAAGP